MHKQTISFSLSCSPLSPLFILPVTKQPSNTQNSLYFSAMKNSEVATASTCGERHMTLLQGHLRFLICTPQRSHRLDWCPAQTATAGQAACIYPFLCSKLTDTGMDKVVQQGELTFGVLAEKKPSVLHFSYIIFSAHHLRLLLKMMEIICLFCILKKKGAKKILGVNQIIKTIFSACSLSIYCFLHT